MAERLTHVWVVAWSTVLESVRRKDIYVVWMLALFGVVAGKALTAVGVRGTETFLRDTTLTVINALSVVICIWLAGRQMPEEFSRRTLFPLLARPVARFDVLLGKLAAVWALSCGALAVLAVMGWLALYLFGAGVGPIYLQFVLLRALSFGPIAAMTITLSLILSPAPTVTLSFLLTLCWTVFARTLQETILQSSPVAQVPLKVLYFLAPHLDLFDISQRTAYDWPPIPAWAMLALAGYSAAYVVVFLALGAIRFRRMAV